MKTLIVLLLLPLMFLQTSAQETEKPCPCCGEEYRQFDFWAGDWNAYGPKGNLVGTNNILLLQDKCILQENWSSGGGAYTGTSYNFYDAEVNKWKQLWIDNKGGSLELAGEFKDGVMVLQSQVSTDAEGNSNISRITWTPNDDGTVRQHWEVSKDLGESWTTAFDGLYKKKETDN